MVSIEHGETPSDELTSPLHLRLPGMLVTVGGAIPPSVARSLSDLCDARLHLDAAAPQMDLTIDRLERSWRIQSQTGSQARAFTTSAGPNEADVLDSLIGRLNRVAFEDDAHRLHLHSAAVEVEGVGVLLAGVSGSGKSTITVELLRRGAAYLSDECVTVLPGSRTVFAYPKPITLKSGSIERSAQEVDHPVTGLDLARNGRAHLRAGAIAEVVPYTTLGLIIAVRHSDDDPPSLRPISPAEACVRLLGDSLDGVRLGPSSLDVLSGVVAGASTWELVYRDASDASALIEQLRAPVRRRLVAPFRLVPPPDAASVAHDGASSPVRSADLSARVARFDDCAALYDGASRSLAVLDEDQTAEVERGESGAIALLRRADEHVAPPGLAAPQEPADEWAVGLPDSPFARLELAPSVSRDDLRRAAVGRCSGVLAEQVVRGRECDDRLLTEQWEQHRAAQSTCVLLERELPRVIGLLEAAGVWPVVLKGPVSSHDGPLPPHFRDYGDLDLLVPPGRIPAAVAALAAAGFDRRFPQISEHFDRRFVKSVTLQSQFSGAWDDVDSPTFEVDLHRTLAPGPYGEGVPLDDLFARAVPVRVHGRWYRSLHPTHRFLHHCLHVALGSPEPRLHSLRDLVLSAPRTPALVVEVLDTARRWGVVGVVQEAIRLAEARFPHSLVSELVDDATSARRRPIERLYLSSYHRRNRSYSLPALTTLLALPTWRDRVDLGTALLLHRRSRRGE